MKRPILVILLIFIIWRIFLFLPLYVGHQVMSYRPGYEYTVLWDYTKQYAPVDNYLLYPWSNFDGVAYLSIAGKGYGLENGRFFPFYPLVISMVSLLFGRGDAFGGIQFFTAFFLANIFFLLSLFLLYRILLLDFSKKVSIQSIIALVVFPVSFFFGSIYSESIFLFLSLLCFYFARKKQWKRAAVFGLLLTATRSVGICMLPVLLCEFFLTENVKKYFIAKDKKNLLKIFIKSLTLFLIPLGLISFIIFNFFQWHDPFYFLHSQGTLKNGRSLNAVILFPQTIYRYLKILITVSHAQFEWWIALLELASFIFASILIYIAWRKKIRVSYILFTLFCFLIPASSGTFTGLPRYIAVLFPLFLVLGLIKNKILLGLYIGISVLLLFILTMFFANGYLVA